jgi:hypothetical protein
MRERDKLKAIQSVLDGHLMRVDPTYSIKLSVISRVMGKIHLETITLMPLAVLLLIS